MVTDTIKHTCRTCSRLISTPAHRHHQAGRQGHESVRHHLLHLLLCILAARLPAVRQRADRLLQLRQHNRVALLNGARRLRLPRHPDRPAHPRTRLLLPVHGRVGVGVVLPSLSPSPPLASSRLHWRLQPAIDPMNSLRKLCIRPSQVLNIF